MTEQEVIIVDGIPDKEYDSLVEESVRYAIISLPFTVNRMNIRDDQQRALNIAKGKVAEKLFRYFCQQNKIEADFEMCATPFWTTDNRDFLLLGDEWDIKNNFLYHPQHLFENYTLLPALVPNRFQGDQWSKRNRYVFPFTKQVKFLFTFLKNADLMKGKCGDGFLKISLSIAQNEFLKELYAKYEGKAQQKRPFTEEGFWEQISKRGKQPLYTLRARPNLIITAYAGKQTFSAFSDTGKGASSIYKDYTKPSWYQSKNQESISFLDGAICTRIKNATCPVAELPSFYSLFPHLLRNMKCARLHVHQENQEQSHQ